jgi:hypothetical protein
MTRAGRVATVALLMLALGAAPAGAVEAWDGTNPFRCTLQQAGFEATGPDPGADPYCVDFDKRRQNVTELGVVEFLSKEPARLAAAVDKCFYFQSDHWRGSIEQDDPRTRTYEWDGRYFFDKARGEGGAFVSNFSVTPLMPPFTGGLRHASGIPVEQRCVELAQREPCRIYAEASGCSEPVAPARRD